jgi:hypothetical protein
VPLAFKTRRQPAARPEDRVHVPRDFEPQGNAAVASPTSGVQSTAESGGTDAPVIS